MKITILSMFPESFESFLAFPVVKRAVDRNLLELEIIDVKKFAGGSFRHIDDSPCGGGPGMIMRIDTLMRALDSVRKPSSHTVLLSPKGQKYTQKRAREFAMMDDIIIVCGHYEGVDRRFENHVDEMISIGDYILTGGEIPAMCITDSVARLLRGALREGATTDESHENGLLEYPQYTKPVDWNGEKVPEILLSGNHGAIDKWRRVQALKDTRKYRPDMFSVYEMSEEERRWLSEADQTDE